jgi:hypothetical protein
METDIKKNPKLKYLVSNEGSTPVILFLETSVIRESLAETTKPKNINFYSGYKFWNEGRV